MKAPRVPEGRLNGAAQAAPAKVLGYFQLPLRGAHAVRAGTARRPTRAFVPEGHPIVAQRFIAGNSMDESTSRPGGTLERWRPSGPSTKVLGYFQLPLRGTHAVRAGAARRPTRTFVPEGHPIIAQRFIGGVALVDEQCATGSASACLLSACSFRLDGYGDFSFGQPN